LVYAHRGLAYARRGQYDQAWSDAEQALQYDPELALAYTLRAIVYHVQGDAARARSALDRAQELDDTIEAQPDIEILSPDIREE